MSKKMQQFNTQREDQETGQESRGEFCQFSNLNPKLQDNFSLDL